MIRFNTPMGNLCTLEVTMTWFNNVRLTSDSGGSIQIEWTSIGIRFTSRIPKNEQLGSTTISVVILRQNHARSIIHAFESLDDGGFGAFTLRGTRVMLRVDGERIVWTLNNHQFWMQCATARNFVFQLAQHYSIGIEMPTD